jgi:hypothetical protein
MTRTRYCVAPPAGDQAERRLDLTEDGRFARGEAHVARQDELAAGAADSTLDLCDGDEATGAEMAEQGSDRGFAGQLRRLGPVLGDRVRSTCEIPAAVRASRRPRRGGRRRE